jgi:hypothetical protein
MNFDKKICWATFERFLQNTHRINLLTNFTVLICIRQRVELGSVFNLELRLENKKSFDLYQKRLPRLGQTIILKSFDLNKFGKTIPGHPLHNRDCLEVPSCQSELRVDRRSRVLTRGILVSNQHFCGVPISLIEPWTEARVDFDPFVTLVILKSTFFYLYAPTSLNMYVHTCSTNEGANPTTVIYNASAVIISRVAYSVLETIFFSFKKRSSLLQRRRWSCKFRSRKVGCRNAILHYIHTK